MDKNVMYINTVTHRYYLSYHANGGANAPVNSAAYDKGASVPIAGPGSMSREGYTFSGWNTRPDGSGTKYAAGSTYPHITGSIILYAQWQKLERVGIRYDANRGQDALIDSNLYDIGSSVPVLGAGNMNWEGHTFTGWNTKPDGSGASYTPGSSIQNMKTTLTLYAQWQQQAFLSSPSE